MFCINWKKFQTGHMILADMHSLSLTEGNERSLHICLRSCILLRNFSYQNFFSFPLELSIHLKIHLNISL